MIPQKSKIVVAMSGGVDSSVAAALLKRQGHEVLGCFMRLGTPEGVEQPETCSTKPGAKHHHQGCCSVLDAGDARRVANLLEIPFYVLNFQEDFGRVIDYFVSEYNAGRTPNPCVRCNNWLKFGKLAQYAEAVGADYVASGHYARIGVDPATGRRALFRGRDLHKDQSYVLFGLGREAMQHMLLPIGEFEKHDVRQMAQDWGLPVFNKPDSQEICFVPDQDYAGLIQRRSPQTVREGELVTPEGQVVGRHQGHQHFTIGQRKGLGVALGYPIYVQHIDPRTNRVTVGDKQSLLHHKLIAREACYHTDRAAAARDMPCLAQIRYNHTPQPARLTAIDAQTFEVVFDEAQSAITPGQAVALYEDDLLLGGGWIDQIADPAPRVS